MAGKIWPQIDALSFKTIQAPGCGFSWHSSKPLVAGLGSDWDFQNPVELGELARKIEAYHRARTEGAGYSSNNPMFFCIAGPGTGKSRLLDEFPKLVQSQIFQGDQDEEILRLLRNAFTFKIRFDGETPIAGDFLRGRA